MKKTCIRILSILAALVICFSCFACGKKKEPDAGNTGPPVIRLLFPITLKARGTVCLIGRFLCAVQTLDPLVS